MPRLPSYRLHKGSGQGVTTIRGKDFYFGPYDDPKSKAKFRKLLGEYLSSSTPTSFRVDAKQVTMAELAVDYLVHCKGYYSSSEYQNIVLAMRPILDLYPETLIGKFHPACFKACRQWWLESGASRQYANKQMARLLRAIKWGVSEGICSVEVHQACKCVDPIKKGRTNAPEAPPVLPVDDSVVDATLPHLTPVVASMVQFQRLVGCRPGEVCKITPAMVDRSNSVWEVRLVEHKGAWRGKQRVIYVGPQAQSILKPYLDRKPDEPCFSPKESEEQRLAAKHAKRQTALSCGNRPGSNLKVRPKKQPRRCYDTQSYGRSIAYACGKAFPVPPCLTEQQQKQWKSDHTWSPNQLRHSRATELRKLYGIEAASLILGHAGLEVTQVYAERDKSKAIQVAMEVG
jgi:integrase